MVEIYDIAPITDDGLIKKLYKTFTKYQAASPLEIEFFVKQIYEYKSEIDEQLDNNTPMPSEGAPALIADIPDEPDSKTLPANLVCRRCGASNLPDSAFCSKCDHSLAIACPSCGHMPEGGMSFCIKCGTKLD